MIASANQAQCRYSAIDPADCSKMRFACGQCGAVYRASFRLAGRLIRCRHCGSPCHVPHGLPRIIADHVSSLRLPPRVAHAKYLDHLETRFVAENEVSASDATEVLPRSRSISRLLIAANVAALAAILVMVVGFSRNPSTGASTDSTVIQPRLVEPAF